MNSYLTPTYEDDQSLAVEGAAPPESFLSVIGNPIFWVALSTAASAYQDLRSDLGGLHVHPYLIVSFCLIFRVVRRLHFFPGRIGRPAMLFLGMFVFVLMRDKNAASYLAKMGAIVVTFVMIALSVRTPRDFFAGVIGLGLCVTILSIKGMVRGMGSYGSINPIEGTQKNAFSLYYLPAFAICLEVLQWPDVNQRRRLLLLAMLAVISAGILLSTNRSGWISAACTIALVVSASPDRARMFVVISVVALFGFLVAGIIRSGSNDIVERDSSNMAESDTMRLHLITTALSALQDNPLIGISPSKLRASLRSVSGVDLEAIDVHNLTAFLLGGFGVCTFLGFCVFSFAMLRPPPNLPRFCQRNDPRLLSYRLLRNIFVVWLLRAQFQEDALFSPTFCMGIALCVGHCISQGLYARRASVNAWNEVPVA